MSVLYEKLLPLSYMPLKTVLKIFGSIVFVALILVPCVLFLDGSAPLKFAKNFNSPIEHMEVKTILYWTEMFTSDTFYFGDGDIFRDCKISACRTTNDRNFMKIEEFDALLFHGIETRAFDIPPARSPHQKYVFVVLESPANYALDATYLPDEFYNWTMTYRRDSDIPWAYGYFINTATNGVAYPLWARDNMANDTIRGNYLSPVADSGRFKGKRKAAAWFVSHCHTTGLRDRYVKELQKHIQIDIYGACGPMSCKSGSEKCYQMLERRYYFYIAFENSLCQDYVTEKLYKLMSYEIVPIVYGAVNYSEFAPPGSYINVADFEGPMHLAKYLNHLMNTPEEYGKFFWWKKYFSADLSHHVAVCKMCEILHDQKSLAPSNILDVKKWWAKRTCLDPFKFLESVYPAVDP